MDALDEYWNQTLISWLQTSGLGVFIWFLINGIKHRIEGLERVVDAQRETIKVMDTRIRQAEGIGQIYKSFFDDIPGVMENYKAIITKDREASAIEFQRRSIDDAQKLEDADRRVSQILMSSSEREAYLKQLNKLIGKPKAGLGHMDKLYLLQISEFNGRLVDEAVPHLLASLSLDEFLKKLGFKLRPDMTWYDFRGILESQLHPDGCSFHPALICNIGELANLVVINELVWSSPPALEILKAEFEYLKEV